MQRTMRTIDQAPAELADAVREFFPPEQWDNAVSVSWLESGWSAFAEADTRTEATPCGGVLRTVGDLRITAEWSIGWFQINACNLPADWKPEHLFNTRHNVGTAHAMWASRGWEPWELSAEHLGLL